MITILGVKRNDEPIKTNYMDPFRGLPDDQL